ncbi:MAG: dTDP-4-dehydrorhamnose reductase [Candidatus Omnitrophica bacterium]|nr:dTDP-4-dehydrorhamnose reductase [Candidatus Omnitrophota bacterium]
MDSTGKKYFIAGSAGQLGGDFARILAARGLAVVAPAEDEFDITDSARVSAVLAAEKPAVLINCAAYNQVDEAESQADAAFLVNATAVASLAETCRDLGIFLVHFSSAYVFDGTKDNFYTEDDPPQPLNTYGASKLQGEQAVAQHLEQMSLVFRLSWVFGPGKQNFLTKVSRWVADNAVIRVSADETSAPTFTEDVVDLTMESLAKGLTGLYHLTNSGYCSRYEWAKYFINKMELDTLVIPVAAATFTTKAKRPAFSCMSNRKLSDALGRPIPSWEDAVERFVLAFETAG